MILSKRYERGIGWWNITQLYYYCPSTLTLRKNSRWWFHKHCFQVLVYLRTRMVHNWDLFPWKNCTSLAEGAFVLLHTGVRLPAGSDAAESHCHSVLFWSRWQRASSRTTADSSVRSIGAMLLLYDCTDYLCTASCTRRPFLFKCRTHRQSSII